MIDWICARLHHPMEVPLTRRRYVELRCRCGAYRRLVDSDTPLTTWVMGWGPGTVLRVRLTPRLAPQAPASGASATRG